MGDWDGFVNLMIATIVGLGIYSSYYWAGMSHLVRSEALLILIVIFVYAAFLQLGDIKRRMK